MTPVLVHAECREGMVVRSTLENVWIGLEHKEQLRAVDRIERVDREWRVLMHPKLTPLKPEKRAPVAATVVDTDRAAARSAEKPSAAAD